MEREPSSCEYMLTHATFCADKESEENEGRIYVEPNEHYYAPRLEGTDFDHWCSELLNNHLFTQWLPTMRGHFAGTEKTYYEITNSLDRPLKLSMKLPFQGTGIGNRLPSVACTATRKAAIERVAGTFLTTAAPISGISLWFHDFEFMYAVWPTFALSNTHMRTLVSVLLPHVPAGAFDHMTTRYDRVTFPLFPVPGCQFIGIFDAAGEPLQYDSRRHRVALAHLAHNGGFNRVLPDAADPNESLQENWRKLFAAMRISDLLGCTRRNDPEQLRDPQLGLAFRTAQVRVAHALHPPAPPQPPDADLANARLRFDTPDYYDPRYAVGQLKAIVASLADPLDHTPVLKQLNQWFLVERYAGQVTLYQKSLETQRFMRDSNNPHYYLTLAKSSVADVRGRLNGIELSVQEGGKVVRRNPIDVWLMHESLNTVREVTINILPSSAELVDPYAVPLVFNNWRGFDFYRKGHYARLHALHRDKTLAQLFDELHTVRTIHALVYGVLCNGDPIAFRAVTLFLANVLQLPNDPPRKCVVARGAEGVGKSMLTKELVQRVFGFEHAAVFSDPNMVIGNFNAPSSGKAFAVMEEAFLADDKHSAGRLQQTITGEWQMINEKFQAVKLEWNQLSMWLNSNKGFVVHMNRDARRYMVLEVNDIVTKLTSAQKVQFFSQLVSYIEGDGLFEYAYFLARVDLGEWLRTRAQFILHNQALALQKSKSLTAASPVHAWLDDRYYSGVFGKSVDPKTGTTKRYGFNRYYDFAGLKDLFDAWHSKRVAKGGDLAMGPFLKELQECLNSNADFVVGYDVDLPDSHSDFVGDFPYLFMPDRRAVRNAINRAVAGLEMATDTTQDIKRRKVNDAIQNKQTAVHVTDLYPDAAELAGKTMFEYLFGAADSIKI